MRGNHLRKALISIFALRSFAERDAHIVVEQTGHPVIEVSQIVVAHAVNQEGAHHDHD